MAWQLVGNIRGPSGSATAKTWFQGHTFAIDGELTSGLTIPEFFVPIANGQAVTITGARAKIKAGTSIVVSLTRNGSVLGTGQTITTTAASLTYNQALATLDAIGITTGTAVGTPTDLTFTIILQYTV
jgi:hypothetical protein